MTTQSNGLMEEAPAPDMASSDELNKAPPPEASQDASLEPTNGAEFKFSENVGEGFQKMVQDKGWTSVDDVLKSYQGIEKLSSGKPMSRPVDDAPKEDFDRYYNSLGRPETAEGYEFADPGEALRAADPTYETTIKEFSAFAHEAGISKDHAEKAVAWFNGQQNTTLEGMQAEQVQLQEQNEVALKTEFGPAYEAKIAMASNVAKEFATPEAFEAMEQLTGYPAIVKMMLNIGKSMGEDKFMGDGAGKFGMTPDEISNRINAIYADPDYKANTNNPDRYQMLQKELNGLFEKQG